MIRAAHPLNSHVWVLAMVLPVLLAACSSPVTQPVPTQSLSEPPTAVPATKTPLPPTATPPPPSPTATSLPTDTPTVLPTDTITVLPSATLTPTLAIPPTVTGEDAIFIYLVDRGTGGPLACGDTLVPINTGQARSGDLAQDVQTALQNLFVKRQYILGLYNPVYISNISVTKVWYKEYSQTIYVRLEGTYVRSDDRCDTRRVREQIWATIRQFGGVKVVDILLNDNLLGDILAGR
jgi:hypothetical protein